MEFMAQHREAIAETVRIRNEVSVDIFDDKQRTMGTVSVENAHISIVLLYLPGMVDSEATGEFLTDSIKLGIEACWKAKPEAFEASRA